MLSLRNYRKRGIAFGGGATRGFAHIGVIKVFEENNLYFDYVTGNSAGSIIGAFYANGMGWEEMYDFAKAINVGDIIGLKLNSPGLFNSEKIEKLVEKKLGDKTFEELRLPYRCVAVDLYSGSLVELFEGKVSKAVRASCSIPGVFTPTEWKNKLLIDGGLMNSVPGDVVRKMGARFVVGINLNADREIIRTPKSGAETMFSSLKIIMNHNTERGLAKADVIIEPDLHGFTYYDLKRIDKMIELGEIAAKEKILPLLRGFGKWKDLFVRS